MLVLAVETSDNLCSVAFWENGAALAEYNHEIPMKHTELVGELIRSGLDFLEKEFGGKKQVELAAAAIGPGSFTGLRIGLSFLQGFCYGRNIPIVGVSNQQVLAAQSVKREGVVYTAIDARRNEFFIAENEKSSANLSVIKNHTIVKRENLADFFPNRAEIVFMRGAKTDEALYRELEKKKCLVHKRGYSASLLAEIGYEKYTAQGGDDADTLEPMYVRPFAGVN
jgi:tRNA threonylcarbamoyladenosine biosynthesis protein TsaB